MPIPGTPACPGFKCLRGLSSRCATPSRTARPTGFAPRLGKQKIDADSMYFSHSGLYIVYQVQRVVDRVDDHIKRIIEIRAQCW